MSKHRIPHGQYVRQTTDWFSDRLMVGGGSIAAAPALYGGVTLANNTTIGEILLVQGLDFWVQSATGFAVLNLYPAAVGNTTNGYQAPLNPLRQARAGYCGAGTTAGPITPFLYTLGGNNQPYTWVHNWPLVILPPHFTLSVYTSAVNMGITAAFYWLVMPPE